MSKYDILPSPHSFWVYLPVLRAENERSSERQNQFILGGQGGWGKKIGGSWEKKAQTEFFGSLGGVLRDEGIEEASKEDEMGQ